MITRQQRSRRISELYNDELKVIFPDKRIRLLATADQLPRQQLAKDQQLILAGIRAERLKHQDALNRGL